MTALKPSLAHPQRWGLIIGIMLFVVATGLRLAHLGYDSLWLDEAFTHYDATKLPISNLLLGGRLIADFNHPPLYFLLAHLCWQVSQTDAALRFPAAAAGILGIGAIWLLAVRLFGKREGIVAAILLTMSPMAIHYAQEARDYTALWLYTMLSAWAFWAAVQTNKPQWWLLTLLINLLGLYNSYLQFLIVVTEIGFFGIWAIAKLPIATKKGLIYLGLTVAAFMLLSQLFGLNFLDNVVQSGADGEQSLQDKIVQDTLPNAIDAFRWTHLYNNPIATVLFLSLMGLGIVGSIVAGQRWQTVFLLLLILVPITLLIISNPPHTEVYSRYFTIALSFYFILMARGMVLLHDVILQRVRYIRRGTSSSFNSQSPVLWASMIGLLVLLHIPALQLYYAHVPGYFRSKPEWKEALQIIEAAGGAGQRLVTVQPDAEFTLSRYVASQRVDSQQALDSLIAEGQPGYLIYDSWIAPPPWLPVEGIEAVPELSVVARFPQVIVYGINLPADSMDVTQ